jgi:hypothetical protein
MPPEEPSKNEGAFLAFIDANPTVLDLFCRFAWEMKQAGIKSIGAPAVWERVRWEFLTNPDYAGMGFKGNNNHRSYMARLAMERHPEQFAGFFTIRKAAAPKPARKPRAKPVEVPVIKPQTIMLFSDIVAAKEAKTEAQEANKPRARRPRKPTV